MLNPQPTLPLATAYYLGGAVLIAIIAWIGYRFPATVSWPYPIMLVIPAWLLGQSLLGNIDAGPRLIPLLGVLPFLVVAVPVLFPKSRAVWPALGFTGLLIATSLVYFVFSWSYGLKYQGFWFTVVLAIVNTILATLSIWVCVRAMKMPTFWRRYLAALTPCVWFVWCAFPWLGEMP